MGGTGADVCGGGIVEGEEMRLALILCLAVPLVVCAAVCDCVEWCIRRARK